MYKKIFSVFLLGVFLAHTIFPPKVGAQIVSPIIASSAAVGLSDGYNPPLLKGLKVYPKEPLRLDFILDQGDQKPTEDETTRLIKYFLASLTVPEKDMWVNLSPYEKDRIVPEAFGQTEMGRDLLAQDYLLKQISASLLYPEGETGKKFWSEVYRQASEKYGVSPSDIPVDAFNKVWITPAKAVLYENAKAGAAYVVESRLKVMLEADYLAANLTSEVRQTTSEVSQKALREIIIPILEKEVNEGANFAPLRQVYHSLILATWYKKKINDSLMAKVYVNQNKIAGVTIEDKTEKDKIWAQYVESVKKGAYNYIKEEYDPATQETIPRKYFSGGFGVGSLTAHTLEVLEASADLRGKTLDRAMRVHVVLDPAWSTGDAAMTDGQKKMAVFLLAGVIAVSVFGKEIAMPFCQEAQDLYEYYYRRPPLLPEVFAQAPAVPSGVTVQEIRQKMAHWPRGQELTQERENELLWLFRLSPEQGVEAVNIFFDRSLYYQQGIFSPRLRGIFTAEWENNKNLRFYYVTAVSGMGRNPKQGALQDARILRSLYLFNGVPDELRSRLAKRAAEMSPPMREEVIHLLGRTHAPSFAENLFKHDTVVSKLLKDYLKPIAYDELEKFSKKFALSEKEIRYIAREIERMKFVPPDVAVLDLEFAIRGVIFDKKSSLPDHEIGRDGALRKQRERGIRESFAHEFGHNILRANGFITDNVTDEAFAYMSSLAEGYDLFHPLDVTLGGHKKALLEMNLLFYELSKRGATGPATFQRVWHEAKRRILAGERVTDPGFAEGLAQVNGVSFRLQPQQERRFPNVFSLTPGGTRYAFSVAFRPQRAEVMTLTEEWTAGQRQDSWIGINDASVRDYDLVVVLREETTGKIVGIIATVLDEEEGHGLIRYVPRIALFKVSGPLELREVMLADLFHMIVSKDPVRSGVVVREEGLSDPAYFQPKDLFFSALLGKAWPVQYTIIRDFVEGVKDRLEVDEKDPIRDPSVDLAQGLNGGIDLASFSSRLEVQDDGITMDAKAGMVGSLDAACGMIPLIVGIVPLRSWDDFITGVSPMSGGI